MRRKLLGISLSSPRVGTHGRQQQRDTDVRATQNTEDYCDVMWITVRTDRELSHACRGDEWAEWGAVQVPLGGDVAHRLLGRDGRASCATRRQQKCGNSRLLLYFQRDVVRTGFDAQNTTYGYQLLKHKLHSFDLSWICCTTRCTTNCRLWKGWGVDLKCNYNN